jgi:hypothetical protein
MRVFATALRRAEKWRRAGAHMWLRSPDRMTGKDAVSASRGETYPGDCGTVRATARRRSRLASTFCAALTFCFVNPASSAPQGPEKKLVGFGCEEIGDYWAGFTPVLHDDGKTTGLHPTRVDLLVRRMAQENRSIGEVAREGVSWFGFLFLNAPSHIIVLQFGSKSEECSEHGCPGEILYLETDGRIGSIKSAIGKRYYRGNGFPGSLFDPGERPNPVGAVVLTVDGQPYVLFNKWGPGDADGDYGLRLHDPEVMPLDAFAPFVMARAGGDAKKKREAENFAQAFREQALDCLAHGKPDRPRAE